MGSESIESLKEELRITKEKLQQTVKELAEMRIKLEDHKKAIKNAKRASEMKSLFLANMSHEIRTPLNAVEGFSRIMAETDDQEERYKFMEIIESNNARLLSLINEILDLSRMESGKVKIKKENVELDEMCRNISQIFKFRFADTVKMELRPANTSLTLYTDENRLIQVFSNLISNALKHTIEGYIAFGYNLQENGKMVEFFVEDSGAGIAKEDIDTIFQTYVSRDAEKQKGTGLGLALCKVIIEKMKGKIWVESEKGKGSKFIFTLPFEVDGDGMTKDGRQATLVRTIGEGDTTGSNADKLVLVAEDEDTNYMLVESVLGRRCRLLRARDGIEAVTMAEEYHPSLILMDIRMPNMNGLDATRIIKEVNSAVPVVALSAYAYASDIQEALNAGCNEFIAKPYKLETLVETVDRYLKN
ncbi:MAG: response regulator [Prevotella sp.]|nr:response regulator [Prevotella sp.]